MGLRENQKFQQTLACSVLSVLSCAAWVLWWVSSKTCLFPMGGGIPSCGPVLFVPHGWSSRLARKAKVSCLHSQKTWTVCATWRRRSVSSRAVYSCVVRAAAASTQIAIFGSLADCVTCGPKQHHTETCYTLECICKDFTSGICVPRGVYACIMHADADELLFQNPLNRGEIFTEPGNQLGGMI